MLLISIIFAVFLLFRAAYFAGYKSTAVFPVMAASDDNYLELREKHR